MTLDNGRSMQRPSEYPLAASVVIVSRKRPLRLRWLLNALREQTLAPDRFEVIVAYDPASETTRALLRGHPLRQAGGLRSVTFPHGASHPGAGRNAAWRSSSAPLILFTEDDCRPAPDWVEKAVAAAGHHPGAIVQGRTMPDPDDAVVASTAPWTRTRSIFPPSPWAESCNVAYPRQILEQAAGFHESMPMGEDADLACRARRLGAGIVGEPEMLVYHAVEDQSLLGAMRAQRQGKDLALLVKRHPALRREMWGLIWSRPQDAALTAALAAALGAGRKPAVALGALPWITMSLVHRRYGYRPRAIARAVSELPGRALIDGAWMAAMVQGSVRHGTLLL
jgi:hypothetical protein